MIGERAFRPLALGIALMGCASALGNPKFHSSEIEGRSSNIIFCDLDGDQLKDAVLIDGLNLSIFYQDPKQGFSRRPQEQVRLEDRPAVVFPAKLGRTAESLVVMTSAGVTELCFTNRPAPPVRHQILEQQTIIPESLEGGQVMYFAMSAKTGGAWPLLLVPSAGELQVWRHGDDGRRRAQSIRDAVDSHLWLSVANPGYTQLYGLSMSVGDVNGDGRDDLMVKREVAGGMQSFALYLQKPDGLFADEPALTHTNKADWRTSLSWVDINRDGKVDLIQGTASDEASFVPGMRSGKVLVRTWLADDHGRISAEPQQVFRKNDWSSAVPVVDVDGDGFPDLILGYIPISTREGLRKMITARQLDYSLKLHFYHAGSGFSKEPDCQYDAVVHLDRELLMTIDHRLDFDQIINFQGDFNGDGKKDLLLRDRSDELSAYFFISRDKGFSAKPDVRFSCPEPIESCDVKDLNGDGLSDVIVKLQNQNVYRIFISEPK